MPDDVPPDRRPRLTVIRGRKRGGSSAVHEGLVGARKLIGTPYLNDPALRAEYARDIAPRTEAALARVLAALAAPSPARAIDLGAGTGAVGRTLRARYGDGLDVVAVDRTAALGVVRANLAVELPAVDGRFDLVVAAHLLNELYADRSPAERTALRAARVLAWTRALLAPAGRLILIEPALRETSRDLLAVRDRLLDAGLHVVAPCFWAGPCPALARDRDWCHDAAPVPSKPRVDFSYLVLSAEPVAPAPHYRVVSDPLPEKGRLRLFVCGPTGRHQLVRLDRHRAPANAALDRATRGDALSLGDAERADDDSLRAAAGTTVALPRRGRVVARGSGNGRAPTVTLRGRVPTVEDARRRRAKHRPRDPAAIAVAGARRGSCEVDGSPPNPRSVHD